MPILKASKKALRTARRKQERNRQAKKTLKQALRRAGQGSNKELSKTVSVIDRAAKKKIIHPNRAARLKSKIARRQANHKSQAPKSK